jgi:hypothetical protein
MHSHDHPKPLVVVTIVGIPVVPVGGARPVLIVVPGAAAHPATLIAGSPGWMSTTQHDEFNPKA